MSNERVDKAVGIFVDKFGGSFKKMAPDGVDYRIYNTEGTMVSYAQTAVIPRRIINAYPLPILAGKVQKLCDKRLNPVIIWVCEDGIIYAKVNHIEGRLFWGESSRGGQDLIVEYGKQDAMKYIKTYV
jgi:hypothetical protein